MDTDDTKALDSISKRVHSIEKALGLLQSKEKELVENGKLTDKIADHVGMIGLSEAVTWPRRPIRYIWAFLFCMGLLATGYFVYSGSVEYFKNPTATAIKYITHPEYEYPPLIVCPGMWLNGKKALSMGLSPEAIKYSLSYINHYSLLSIDEIDKGRKEFWEFYNSKNYSRLLEYFKDISVDMVPLPDDFESFNSTFYKCAQCVKGSRTTPLEKVVINRGICYVVEFKRVLADIFLVTDALATIAFRMEDQTAGIMEASTNWDVYLMPDKYLSQPNFPPIAVPRNMYATLKLNVQKFQSIKSESNPCLEESETKPDYSPGRCVVKCLHKMYFEKFGCHLLFYYSSLKLDVQPYCNLFDVINGTNVTHYELLIENSTIFTETQEAKACVKRCPHKCSRDIFLSTMDSEFPILLDLLDSKMTGDLHKWTFSIDHTAAEMGGILTRTEVRTFSFTAFVSNIGGTLGLFLGATVMTFFQVGTVLLDWILAKRKKTDQI